MNRRSLMLLFVILIAGCSNSISPRVVVEGENYFEIGLVEPTDVPIKRSVSIRNDGSGDLELLDVQVSCGCTRAECSSRRIAGGSAGLITMFLDAKELGGHEAIISITTNDSKTPRIQFRANWTVGRGVTALPADLNGISIYEGDEDSIRIELAFNDGVVPAKLTARSVESTNLGAIVHDAQIEGTSCIFTIRAQSKSSGQYRGMVEILSNQSIALAIPWKVQVDEVLKVLPKVAYFKDSGQGSFSTQLVIQGKDESTLSGLSVTCNCPSDVQVKRITSTECVVNVKLRVEEFGNAQEIKVSSGDGQIVSTIPIGR